LGACTPYHKRYPEQKELKTLFDAGTFMIDSLSDGKISVPVMELFKVKIVAAWIS
jgi:hypothetical protein